MIGHWVDQSADTIWIYWFFMTIEIIIKIKRSVGVKLVSSSSKISGDG